MPNETEEKGNYLEKVFANICFLKVIEDFKWWQKRTVICFSNNKYYITYNITSQTCRAINFFMYFGTNRYWKTITFICWLRESCFRSFHVSLEQLGSLVNNELVNFHSFDPILEPVKKELSTWLDCFILNTALTQVPSNVADGPDSPALSNLPLAS